MENGEKDKRRTGDRDSGSDHRSGSRGASERRPKKRERRSEFDKRTRRELRNDGVHEGRHFFEEGESAGEHGREI